MCSTGGREPDGSFRSRQLLLGWDDVPMHRWAQAQMFQKSLALARTLQTERHVWDLRTIQLRRPGLRSCLTIVEQMTQTIAHRGPDDEGYYFAGPLGLGFRRLSIIDLERRPPAHVGRRRDRLGRLQRRDLQLSGATAGASRAGVTGSGPKSDTEVIVHGYRQWGTDVFDRLNGMFGVAIWDARTTAPGPGPGRDGHQADLLRHPG